MPFSRSDREEIYGLSRAAAVEVFSDKADGIFHRINDEAHESLRRLDNLTNSLMELSGQIANTAQTVAVLVAQSESYARTLEKVHDIEVSIPARISDEVKSCQKQRDQKTRWSIGTLISVLSAVIALGALIVSLRT
jgi:hypothetical protein